MRGLSSSLCTVHTAIRRFFGRSHAPQASSCYVYPPQFALSFSRKYKMVDADTFAGTKPGNARASTSIRLALDSDVRPELACGNY